MPLWPGRTRMRSSDFNSLESSSRVSPRCNLSTILTAFVAVILVFHARKSPIWNGRPSFFGIRIGSKLQYVWHNCFRPPHPSSPSSKNTSNDEGVSRFLIAHFRASADTVKPASAYGECNVSAKQYSLFTSFHAGISTVTMNSLLAFSLMIFSKRLMNAERRGLSSFQSLYSPLLAAKSVAWNSLTPSSWRTALHCFSNRLHFLIGDVAPATVRNE